MTPFKISWSPRVPLSAPLVYSWIYQGKTQLFRWMVIHVIQGQFSPVKMGAGSMDWRTQARERVLSSWDNQFGCKIIGSLGSDYYIMGKLAISIWKWYRTKQPFSDMAHSSVLCLMVWPLLFRCYTIGLINRNLFCAPTNSHTLV